MNILFKPFSIKFKTLKLNSLAIIFISIIMFSIVFCGCANSTASEIHINQEIIQNAAAPTDISNLNLPEEMINAGIYNPGNSYRLAKVFEKAGNSNDITIAFIGGSITDGSSAEPKNTKCYAALCYNWFKETFPNTKINYVNAAIGATDSYLGAHRLSKDVLSYNPDLVIVEFAVNDGQSINSESYESLIRHILESDDETAVVTLMTCQESGYDYSSQHKMIAFNYGLPIISYKDAYQYGIDNSIICWNQLGNSDKVHPNNNGHELIAHLLTKYFRDTLISINETDYSIPYEIPKDSISKCRFVDSDILYPEDIEPIENNGFEIKNNISYMKSSQSVWQSKTAGSISFKLKFKTLGIAYMATTDSLSGQFDILIDGETVSMINGDFTNGWGNCIKYTDCKKFDESKEHIITIKLNEDSKNTQINICGLLISY